MFEKIIKILRLEIPFLLKLEKKSETIKQIEVSEDVKFNTINNIKKELVFPVSDGDILVFNSGNKYKVKKLSIHGDYQANWVSLFWLNKPALIFEGDDVFRNKTWSCLRELNFWLENNRNMISEIIKTEYSSSIPKEWTFDMDTLHKLALAENNHREQIVSTLANIGIKIRQNNSFNKKASQK